MSNMTIDLNSLSKEDLIKVIAVMHDTIQDWDNGWGLNNDSSSKLISIGSACVDHCVKTQDWNI